jgi:hypothetical protein
VDTGEWLSIDKQMLGFQGQSRLKLHVSYKNKGDSFRGNAICDKGYTLSFYFHHGDPPLLLKEFKDKLPDLSPTAMHVIWLALCLPYVWTRIFIDNIFNSRKLFKMLHMAQCLVHSIMQTTGCGLPLSVRQLEEKNVREAQKLKGRTMVARLVSATDFPDLFACLVYDT